MSNPFTIVTAFMSQINARGDRPVQKYIDLGKSLLALHILQIVFIERHIYETYLRDESMHLGLGCGVGGVLGFFTYGGRAYEYIVSGHLTFVFFERTDMYLEEYREMATEFSLNTPHPSKDTLDYMFVQCYKTEWVSMAIALTNTHTSVDTTDGVFAWLDFGLCHMYPSSIAFDIAVYGFRDRMISGLSNGSSVCAPSCWDAGRIYSQDVYRDIFWVFSGSAFCGKPNALLDFARRTKSKCIEILSVRRRLMWEVNVWYLVYRDCPALFSLYYGNHNAGILGGRT